MFWLSISAEHRGPGVVEPLCAVVLLFTARDLAISCTFLRDCLNRPRLYSMEKVMFPVTPTVDGSRCGMQFI